MASSWAGRAILGLVALAIVGAVVVVPRLAPSTPAAQPRTQAVTRGNVTQTVAVSGSVTVEQVRLSFRPQGRLSEIAVKVGDAVTAGQVLARLDPTDLQTAVKQAQANVLSAQARYDTTVAGASPEDIELARNALASATANADQALKNAQNDLTAAQRSLDQATQNVADVKSSSGSDIETARLSLDRARADFATAREAFAAVVPSLRSDVADLSSGLGAARTAVADALAATEEIRQSADTTAARNALNSADIALAAAQRNTTEVLTAALDDYATKVAEVSSIAVSFDSAIAAGQDTVVIGTRFQTASSAYQLSSTTLASAIDLPAGQVAAALSSLTSALSSLDSLASQDRWVLDKARDPILEAQRGLIAEQQTTATMRTRQSQATAAVGDIGGAISGSLLASEKAYEDALARRDDSLRSALDGLVSAQDSLAIARDRGASTRTSQQIALQNAQLQFQKNTAGGTSSDIAISLASLQLAQISLDKATTDLDAAALRAPSAGVVASVASQLGESPANPFIVLALTNKLTLHGTVGEADVAKLKKDQVATISVDVVGTSDRLTGRVGSIDPVATISQGVPVYGVDVTIDLPDPAVRAGMTGTATVILASKQSVLTVPNSAIRTTNGVRSLQVMKDGLVEDAQVTFGISNDTVTEVTSGLQEGDLVVLPQRATSTTATQRPGGGFQQVGPGGGGGPVIRGP